MFSVDNIIFSMGGIGVSLLEFLSVVCGLTCVFLAGRGKVLNFYFGYLYCALLFALFMQKHLYSSMILQPVSLIINIVGHYRWTHPRENEKGRHEELKVSVLSWSQRGIYVVAIALLAFLWGWALSNAGKVWPDAFPPAKIPYLDSFVTMMILTAQYLSAQKKIDCWGAWLIVNTTNIILYIMAGLVFMPLVSAAYLILAFFGFGAWKKQLKLQDNVTEN